MSPHPLPVGSFSNYIYTCRNGKGSYWALGYLSLLSTKDKI